MAIHASRLTEPSFTKSRPKRELNMDEKKHENSTVKSNTPLRSWWQCKRVALARLLMRSSKQLAFWLAPELRAEIGEGK